KVAVFVALFRQRRALARHAEVVRELEAERVRLEAAEAAVAMRDEFLSIASHELKTPLTPLQLQLQMLERAFRGESGPSREQVREHLDVLKRQVARMTALIDNLLDVSRIAHGKLSITRKATDLARLVTDACERVREQARRTGCELHITVPA